MLFWAVDLAHRLRKRRRAKERWQRADDAAELVEESAVSDLALSWSRSRGAKEADWVEELAAGVEHAAMPDLPAHQLRRR